MTYLVIGFQFVNSRVHDRSVIHLSRVVTLKQYEYD